MDNVTKIILICNLHPDANKFVMYFNHDTDDKMVRHLQPLQQQTSN